MELIFKPTGVCNFACDFCIAGNASIKHLVHLPNSIKNIIAKLKPTSIIVNGGDPILAGRDIFYELLDSFDGEVAITSNLKDFYYRPDYWVDLFKNERISMSTSFQFGNRRKWDRNTPYTVEKFKEVMGLFKERIGYTPMFISVISTENEDKALDHIYLAKELDTICRLNPVVGFGLAKDTYPFYKMIDIWCDIKERGLEEYTDHRIQFYKGGCVFNTSLHCKSCIRVVAIDNKGDIKYSDCDNKFFQGEYIDIDELPPEPEREVLNTKELINKDCLSCKLCRLCNGCSVSRENNKKDSLYCQEMKKREDRIIRQGWFL